MERLARLALLAALTPACREAPKPIASTAIAPVPSAAPSTARSPAAPSAPASASAASASASAPDAIAVLTAKPPSKLFARSELERALADDDASTWWENQGAAWVDARVARARAGKPELVRAVMVHRGPWGCSCPEYFLGVGAGVNPSNRWVAPVFSAEARPPDLHPGSGDVPPPDALMLVEGWFTGKVDAVTIDAETSNVARFNVVRLRPPREGDLVPRVLGTTLPPFPPPAR